MATPSCGHSCSRDRKVGTRSVAQGFCGRSDFQGACGRRAGVLGLGCLWRLPDAIPKRTAPSLSGPPAPRAGRTCSLQACLPPPDAGTQPGRPHCCRKGPGEARLLSVLHLGLLAGPSLGFPAPGPS